MPRDGSGIFSAPFPDVVEGTTIESAVHNGTVADFVIDANAARPVIAGGTGANNITQARANLAVEVRGVQITNYDSHAFEAGSFWSIPGATGAPDAGNYFVGICYGTPPTNLVIEARVVSNPPTLPAPVYIRSKTNSIWGDWKIDGADQYVNVTGDTMTGNLAITKANPLLNINASDASQAVVQYSQYGTVPRWQTLAQATDGNFLFARFDDGSAFVDAPVGINRATGEMFVTKAPTAGTSVANKTYVDTKVAKAGDTMTGHLHIDTLDGAIFLNDTTSGAAGPQVIGQRGGLAYWSETLGLGAAGDYRLAKFVGGTPTNALYISYSTLATTFGGAVSAPSVSGTTGSFSGAISAGSFSSSGSITGATGTFTNGLVSQGNAAGGTNTVMLVLDSGGSSMNGTVGEGQTINFKGTSTIVGQAQSYGEGSGNYGMRLNTMRGGSLVNLFNIGANGVLTNNGIACRQGLDGAAIASPFNFYWTGSVLNAYINTSNVGTVTLTSDYRIKKDVVDLPSTWETVKGLRPVKYTQAQFTPPTDIAYALKEAAAAREYAAKSGLEPLPAKEPQPMFVADDIERWGFIAHELQETLTPSAATGVKDAPDVIQSPNPFTLIAALTKALQEAMARIETLESATGVTRARK